MTRALPSPLVPAEVDLRDFQYMELDVQMLRDSRFAAEVDAEAFRAGVLLWCAAWHQVPAASLPNNDIELSNLAGFGRVVKEWKKVREQALSSFVECSDGRLYHPTVAEKANAAWKARLHHHFERAKDRLRKANKARAAEGKPALAEFTFDAWNEQRVGGGIPMEKAEASAGIPTHTTDGSAGIPPENALRGNGEGTERERRGKEEMKRTVPCGTDASGVEPRQPATPKTDAELTRAELWSAGKSLLREQGMPQAQCGTFVGKLVKDFGDEVVVEAVRAAVVERPADAATWLIAACKRGKAGRNQPITGERQIAESLAKAERVRASMSGTATATQPTEVIDG